MKDFNSQQSETVMRVRERERLLLRECLYTLQGMNGENLYFHSNNSNSNSTRRISMHTTTTGTTITATSTRTNPTGSTSTARTVAFQCDFPNDASHDPAQVVASRLGNGAHDALQQICGRVGWYYRRLQAYCMDGSSSSSSSPHCDAISRAWAEALAIQLNQSHHSLLADLESQIQQQQIQQQEDKEIGSPHDTSSDLTLRRLMVRLVEPASQLRTLAILVDGLAGLSGGPLLTALHRHSLHGDTRHSTLTQRMLRAACQPWYHALYLWTIRGVLLEPTDDFFVQRTTDAVAAVEPNRGSYRANSTATSSAATAGDVWHSTFVLLHNQVPEILPPSLIQPCFNVGKGINFIRHCLLDHGWNMHFDGSQPQREEDGHDHHHDSHNDDDDDDDDDDPERLGYRYCEDKKLMHTMRRAEQQVNHHIVTSLKEKHHMMQHLRGLKQFLLLGQGDFFSVLMDGLDSEFHDKGIIGMYDYSLMSVVDAALKSTNAASMPHYVLGRLGVKLTLAENDDARYQFGPPKGAERTDTRTGWDIFALEYRIPEPLAAIVHDRAMRQYQRLFSLLFGLKRVEYMLNLTWRQSTALHHAIQIFAQQNAIRSATNAEYAQTTALLRHISMVRQSMMHFVVNLKSYLFFDVLEGAWNTLVMRLETGTSLHDIVHAHDAYLADIVQKSLLGGTNDDDDDDDADNNNNIASASASAALNLEDEDGAGSVAEALGVQLQTLLRLALEFCTFQKELFQDAIQQAERATEKFKEADRRLKQGSWGFRSEMDVKEAKTFFGLTDERKLKNVMTMEHKFHKSTGQFLTYIHQISHGTSDMAAMDNFMRSPSTSDSVSTMVLRDQFSHDSLNSLTFQLDYSSFYNVGGQ